MRSTIRVYDDDGDFDGMCQVDAEEEAGILEFLQLRLTAYTVERDGELVEWFAPHWHPLHPVFLQAAVSRRNATRGQVERVRIMVDALEPSVN